MPHYGSTMTKTVTAFNPALQYGKSSPAICDRRVEEIPFCLMEETKVGTQVIPPTTSIAVLCVSGGIAVIPNLQLGIVAGTNRTGRFPASGFLAKLHTFTRGTQCPTRLKLVC